MNGNTFSLLGYLSVLLWVGVPVLWLIRKRSRWFCFAALALALVSFLFAKINSKTHVNLIEPDHTAQMESTRAAGELKRNAVKEIRGEAVADIRFAEDHSDDFIDKAGMNEADLKYMEHLDKASEPAWKNAKKQRGGVGDDNSLDAIVGGNEAIDGVKTEALEEKKKRAPILMSDADMVMANRLDGLNLNMIRILIVVAVLMIIIDYLGRVNVYAEAFLPLPLPSAWCNAITPIAPVVARPATARRDMSSELAWLVKRGDCFVYLTDDASAAGAVPTSLPRFGKAWGPIDVLHVDGERISDHFVFESLWYARACCVVNSSERSERMFARMMQLLEERKKVRTRVVQTVHVVWDLKRSLSELEVETFTRLGKVTGFSLFICRTNHP